MGGGCYIWYPLPPTLLLQYSKPVVLLPIYVLLPPPRNTYIVLLLFVSSSSSSSYFLRGKSLCFLFLYSYFYSLLACSYWINLVFKWLTFHFLLISPIESYLIFFVGLLGPNPGSELIFSKQIPVLLALSEIVHGARTEVSSEVVWEGARTRFPHPRYVWWVQVVRGLTLCARRYVHFPIHCSLRCCLRAALLGVERCYYPIPY